MKFSMVQEEEVLEDGLAVFGVLGPGQGVLVVDGEHGDVTFVNLSRHIDLDTVHYAVRAAVQDDALDVRQFRQLGRANVMRVNLAVHTQRPNLAGNRRIFTAP